MLRAVAFDLWETLLTDTPEVAARQERLRLHSIESILTSRGYLHTALQIEHAHGALWNRCFEKYWSVDIDVPTSRQIHHFLEALELDPASFDPGALEELERAYSIAALEIPPLPVPHAVAALQASRTMNLGVGLISNTGRTPGRVLREVLSAHGLSSLIDVMVFSNEHGECKPRRSIFDKLCEGLGAEHAEVVFVGDNLYADVHGAQATGMRAILFKPESRGQAVAPEFDHGLEIVPDATIHTLADLPRVLAEMKQ
ncbi:MAG TPA: HAD family hydrolase [Thermoanaerobaculia bacterium]|nr:HAD family hydrolase [Thermoanaerobaculia bacterium]